MAYEPRIHYDFGPDSIAYNPHSHAIWTVLIGDGVGL